MTGTTYTYSIYMRVLGRPILEELKTNHADVRAPIDSWLNEVEESSWKTSQDIKDRFQQASFLSNNVVIFNIKGNRYRVVTKVAYNTEIVKIEFAGTHEEYTRIYS